MKEINQEKKKRREKCHLSGIVLIALQWEKHNAVGRWGKGRRTTQATDKLRCAKNGTASFSSKCPRANPVERWNSKQVCDTHGVVGDKHRLLHTQVRTSVPPLYPWLWLNAHIRCSHPCRKRRERESDALLASTLLPWMVKLLSVCSGTSENATPRGKHDLRLVFNLWTAIARISETAGKLIYLGRDGISHQTLCFSCNIPHAIGGQLSNQDFCHKVTAIFDVKSQFCEGVWGTTVCKI